jgi:oligopeptide/dipeptide ABC transporter ATP-binding protein
MSTQAAAAIPLLQVDGLVKHFKPSRAARRRGDGVIHALCGVSLDLSAGETVGVVGESGSGKTTLLRTLLGLERPTAGSVRYRGLDVTNLKGKSASGFRRRVSVVFQDPFTSLDPRMTVSDLLSEPAAVQRQRMPVARVRALLEQVQLPRDSIGRFPHEFSGGQRQRIAIARALALDPELIVLDEPVSALDVSVQAEIIRLLRDLQEHANVSYLFVAHDLAVVAEVSHRVAVMYGGQMVEFGPTEQVITQPQHPYTRQLLSAVPVPDPVIERAKPRVLTRSWPTPEEPAAACSFGEAL